MMPRFVLSSLSFNIYNQSSFNYIFPPVRTPPNSIYENMYLAALPLHIQGAIYYERAQNVTNFRLKNRQKLAVVSVFARPLPTQART